jgi:hypothetical protein
MGVVWFKLVGKDLLGDFFVKKLVDEGLDLRGYNLSGSEGDHMA